MRVISAAEEGAAGGDDVVKRATIDADLQDQSVEVLLSIEQIPEAYTRDPTRHSDRRRRQFRKTRVGPL